MISLRKGIVILLISLTAFVLGTGMLVRVSYSQAENTFTAVSGYIDVDFQYSESNKPGILEGFKVEIEGTNYSAFSDGAGYFEIPDVDLVDPVVTIRISKRCYLTRIIKDVDLSSSYGVVSLSTSPVLMWAGDVPVGDYGDNTLNMEDIMLVARSFNSSEGSPGYNPDCDLNMDGAVNMEDIQIIIRHFNRASESYPDLDLPVISPTPYHTITPVPTASIGDERNTVKGFVITSNQYVIADDGVDTVVITPVFYNMYNERIENPGLEVSYFINGTLAQSKDFSSTECGSYVITAKIGDLTSNGVQIEVVPKYSISTSIDKNFITADGVDKAIISAKVTDKNGNMVNLEGIKYVYSNAEDTFETTNHEFSTTKISSYEIFAQVGKYKSNTVFLRANQYMRMELSLSKSEIACNGLDYVNLNVKIYDKDNNDITSYYYSYLDNIFYINDVKIFGNRFSSTSTGDYRVYAKLHGMESNTAVVKVVSNPLAASSGRYQVVYKYNKVTLDGSRSTYPAWSTITYNWRIVEAPPGSSAVIDNNNSINPFFVPDMAGEYTVGLSISDGTFTSKEDTVKIKVKNFGDTTDDLVPGSLLYLGTKDDCDFSELVPLTNGWVFTKKPGQNKVLFINVRTGEVGREYVIGGEPDQLEIDFERELLLVSLSSINRIAKIDARTGKVSYISVNGSVREMKIGEKGLLFSLGSAGTIDVVDLESERVINQAGYEENLYYMGYDRNGNNLILGNRGTTPSSLVRYSFNDVTFELKKVQSVWNTGINGRDLAVSNDGKHVAFCAGDSKSGGYATYTVYDTDSSDISKRFGEWYMGWGNYSFAACFTLDSKYLITSAGGSIQTFSVDTHSRIKSLRSWNDSYSKVNVSRGGKLVFALGSNGVLDYFDSELEQSPVTPPEPAVKPQPVLLYEDRITYKGFNVTLDASESRAGLGGNLTYRWSMVSKPYNSSAQIIDPAAGSTYFIPDQVGDYKVSFIANNGLADSNEIILNIKVKDCSSTVDNSDFKSLTRAERHFILNSTIPKDIPLTDGWVITTDRGGRIQIINAITGEIGKQYSVSGIPNSISFDADNAVLYASIQGINKIVKINIYSDTITYIDTPYAYTWLTYGENNIVFASGYNDTVRSYLSIIDTEKNSVLDSMSIGISENAFIEYDKHNNNLFLADRQIGPCELYKYSFNEETGQLKLVQERKFTSVGVEFALSPDGKTIAICSQDVGDIFYKIYVLDSLDITRNLGEWDAGSWKTSLVFSPDGNLLIASTEKELRLFDLNNFVQISSVQRNGDGFNNPKVCISRGGNVIFDTYTYSTYNTFDHITVLYFGGIFS